jgi:hypothetical protein
MPSLCQASPNSDPPRRFVDTYTPPSSSHAAMNGENAGVTLTLKPP